MARSARQVMVGGISLGGGAPVRVQSMTTAHTSDIEKTGEQIVRLYAAGCEIVRVAVRGEEDARAIAKLKEFSPMPVVADIHYSAGQAIAAIESGADKVRINPGNIGGEKQIAAVAACIRAHHIPVRVGSNTGSIEKHFLEKYGRSAEALVESALYNAAILEKYGVEDIVISVKASSVPLTVEAYRLAAKRCGYPLHLGVTEAGTAESGIVKSSIGIGALLLDGIGDTIRVSLTDDPVEEIYAAKRILRACGLEKDFVDVVSCPTCGRCEWDSMGLAKRVEQPLNLFALHPLWLLQVGRKRLLRYCVCVISRHYRLQNGSYLSGAVGLPKGALPVKLNYRPRKIPLQLCGAQTLERLVAEARWAANRHSLSLTGAERRRLERCCCHHRPSVPVFLSSSTSPSWVCLAASFSIA